MIKAQEETKPLLCTTPISVAASQCQRLGYHREVTYQNEQTHRQEHMRRLFWTIYVFDKNMSLLQGHSSNVQDFEIDAQYPALSRNIATRPWDESFIVAIKLARIQGQIYDKLYSTAALKFSPTVRKEHINTLDAAMMELRAELEQVYEDMWHTAWSISNNFICRLMPIKSITATYLQCLGVIGMLCTTPL